MATGCAAGICGRVFLQPAGCCLRRLPGKNTCSPVSRAWRRPPQLHLSSVYYLLVLVVVDGGIPTAKGRSGGSGKAESASSAASYVPYVVYDLLHQGYDVKLYITHAFSAHSHFHREALVMPLALGSTLGFMHFADWPALDLFQALVVVVGLVYLFVRRRDPEAHDALALVLRTDGFLFDDEQTGFCILTLFHLLLSHSICRGESGCECGDTGYENRATGR